MADNQSKTKYSSTEPLVSYNFKLVVDLTNDVPITRVDGFEREMEFEMVQEGGVNDYVHMLRKPRSRPNTLVVHKPAGMNALFDPLEAGAVLTFPLILMVSRSANTFGIIPGMDGQAKRTYMFTGCQVMKKTFGELNSQSSGLLEETVDICYKEFYYLDMPNI